MQALCIYHGNCADGFGAAWAVRAALGDAVAFHAGVYQDPPPDVTGRDVILVDFSYKRPVLEGMAEVADSILVLDHHKSAAEDLAGLLSPSDDWGEHLEHAEACRHEGDWPLFALFDMDRSGAGLAWDYFHPGRARPPLIDHIEDRDLWRFRLSGTREIQAALFSYAYDFDTWDELMAMPVDRLFSDGVAIERKHHKDVAELVGVTARVMAIGGYRVPAANLPYTLTSDAGHRMAAGQPFAACYWDTPEGRVFSLRSRDDGVDVSAVAKLYGGGGHRNAAGFRVPFDRLDGFGAPPATDPPRGYGE